MSAKKDELNRIVEQYKQAKGIADGIIDTHDLAGWALDNGLYRPNLQDEIKITAEAFSQRRQQIVGDCFQLKTDVDVCNEKKGSNIQLSLNFEEDVAEAEYLRDYQEIAA